MVLVQLQQFLPYGHGYKFLPHGQDKFMESVFVFDNINERITQYIIIIIRKLKMKSNIYNDEELTENTNGTKNK